MIRFVSVVVSSDSLALRLSFQFHSKRLRNTTSLASQMLGALGLLLLLTVSPLIAQTVPPDPDAGIQMWSTNEFGIDLATSAVNINIPGRSKTGAIPYSSAFVGTSHAYVWTETVNGVKYKGFAVAGGYAGLLRYVDNIASLGVRNTVNSSVCESDAYSYTNFVIVDSGGSVHPLPTSFYWALPCALPNPTTTTDGSGYTFVALTEGRNGSGNATGTFAVYDRTGRSWAGSCLVGSGCGIGTSVSDPDGNTISLQVNGSTFSETDTLDTTVVTLSETSPPSVSYTNASNTSVSYTPGWTAVNLKTNFNCSGITDFSSSGSVLTSLTMPDTSKYQFVYEPTPNGNGFTNTNPPTYFTGRIAKITYPSGGSISYAYSGGNNGFNCTSYVVPTITVTANDNNGNSNQWTYVNNGKTVKTDPAGNQTVYSLYGEFQTQTTAYQGGCPTSTAGCNGGGTLLRTITTCYNGSFTNCSIALSPGTPVSQTDVYTSYNASSSSLVETKFDTTYGNVLEVKQYDFGAAMPPTGNPVTDTTTTRAGVNGVSCGTVAPYQYDRVCSATTKNSAGNIVSQVNYTYTKGHPTQTSTLTTGSTYLSSTASYNNNGTVASAKDVNGATYTYAYNGTGGCNSLLPTSVTVTGSGLPTAGLTTSTQWDCNGGVSTATTDSNNQTTTTTNYVVSGVADPYYRPLSTVDPLNNTTSYLYSPTTLESVMNFNGTVSTTDTLLTTDGVGRQIFSQTRQGQGSSMFDTIQTTYGWSATGPFTTTSVPYSGTAGQPAPNGTGITTTQNDAVNRPVSVSNTGGGVVNTTYSQNDVLSAVGPAPTGEHTKQTQTQYDGLGRVTSFCGIESSGGTSCGQNTGNLSGVVTTTAYTSAAASQTLSSTRGSQSRSSVLDGMGRTAQVVTPEGGTWTYTYDSNSSCPSGYGGTGGVLASGQLASTHDPNGNLLCYAYDALNRMTGVNANGTTCRHFYYDNSKGYAGIPTGVTAPTYAYGRMVEAATDACATTRTSATLITDEWFSYDQDGNMSDMWELTPHSTQYYHSTATFFSNGTVKTVTLASPTLYEMTYGVEGEGRWNALTDTTTGHDIVTGTTFFPAANPAVVKLTGTTPDKDTYTYDTNTGNMKQFVFTVGNAPSTGSLTGTLAWNPNGSLGQYQIVDGFNAAGSETCYSNSSGSLGYGYDDLDRLIEFDCGSSWGQEYSYDQYDNLTKTILPGHTGTTWNPGYSATTNHCTGCSYDSNGDVTGDGNDVYGWNAFSKIAWTATSGTPTCGTSGSCATYDAFGRMVESSVNSTWKEYWYTQAGKMVMAGTTLSYGRWPTSFGTVETVGTTNFDYLHEDWRGNSRIVSNISNNTVVADQAYTPYGEIYNIFGANNAEYQVFAGMIADLAGSTTTPIMWDTPNRELSYVGRWLSPDPMAFGAFDPTNSQNWNRYAYVLNNPLSVIDPLGLDCIYVDNDTGEQTGFNTGDCDNSTEALANSGIYVDGTVVGGANGINNSNYGTAGPEGTLNFYVEGQEDAQSICVSDCTGAIGSSSDTFTDANSILSSLSSNLNYALGFTRSFLTFTGGPGNKPTCAGQTLRAIASETTGGFIGSQTAETSLKAASVYQAGRALKYAANRTNTLGGIGLICPQCSSIFGGMIRKAEFLGDASEALPLLDVSAAAVKSIPDVKKQAQSGTCATVVP